MEESEVALENETPSQSQGEDETPREFKKIM